MLVTLFYISNKFFISFYIKLVVLLDIGLVNSLEQAMKDHNDGNIIHPQIAHQKLSRMYQWTDVASRTEQVYDIVMDEPVENLSCRLMK